jgi:hypothetical protein
MKTSIHIALYVLSGCLILFFLGCGKGQFGDCLSGRGKTVTETRGLLSFNNVSVNDNISLNILQGTSRKVTISTGENVISSITTSIDENILYIRNESPCMALSDPWNHVEVELTIPEFDTLFISTAGDVMIADTFYMDSAWIRIDESSGTIDLTINARELNVHYQTGTSDIRVYGKCQEALFYTAAYGLLDTRNLLLERTTINNGSSNDCYVSSGTLTLDAKITSMGNIYYQGNPVNLVEVIEGSGKVIKLE